MFHVKTVDFLTVLKILEYDSIPYQQSSCNECGVNISKARLDYALIFMHMSIMFENNGKLSWQVRVFIIGCLYCTKFPLAISDVVVTHIPYIHDFFL